MASLLLLAMTGCQGGGGSGSGQSLESRDLTQKDIAALERLEILWTRNAPEYPREKLELLASKPEAGPWLAKSMTAMSVKAYDNMVRQQVRVRDFMRSEQGRKSFLGRTRTEMEALGGMGQDAIITYLLRDKRAQVREVGIILFENWPEADLFPALEKEYALGDLNSRRAVLLICSERPGSKRSQDLLIKASGDDSWMVRGLAVRPWGASMRVQRDPDAAQKLWAYYERERDSFVRKQTLLAIGELKDSSQVRPLIDLVQTLERQGNRKESRDAIQALEILTGSKPGNSASAWLKWLNG